MITQITITNVYNKNHLGAACELIVATELMRQGFDVFQNTCRTGIADLVVLNPDNMVMAAIDVKSERARYVRKDGSLGTNLSTKVRYENNVWYIGYILESNEFLWPEGFHSYLHDGGRLPGSLQLAS